MRTQVSIGHSKARLIEDFERLGVKKGDMLNVKMSFKAIGKVEGGLQTVFDALLEAVGDDGLICTDSFVNSISPLSPEFYNKISNQQTRSYAGAFANYMVGLPQSYRSWHPVQKFCLVGKGAKELAEAHTADSYAYEVLYHMASANGRNLKIGPDTKVPGVGTTHVAIELSGTRQFRPLSGRRYKSPQGETAIFWRNWSGGCLTAFYQLNAFYEASEICDVRRGPIGDAPAKLTNMRETLAAEIEYLRKDPVDFLTCGNPDCYDCAYTWETHSREAPKGWKLSNITDKAKLKNYVRTRILSWPNFKARPPLDEMQRKVSNS